MDLATILTLISALTAALVSIINAIKAPQVRAQVRETRDQVHDLGKQLNGRLADLIEATRQAAWHAGLLEGQRLAHERLTLPAPPPPGASTPSQDEAP